MDATKESILVIDHRRDSTPLHLQNIYPPNLSLLCLQYTPTTWLTKQAGGEIGWANDWKTQGGAVPLLIYILWVTLYYCWAGAAVLRCIAVPKKVRSARAYIPSGCGAVHDDSAVFPWFLRQRCGPGADWPLQELHAHAGQVQAAEWRHRALADR